MIFGALAVSAAASMLAACGQNVSYEPIKNEAFTALQTQPVNSYKLVPVVTVTEGENGAAPTRQQVDGSFNIIVKTGELKNPQALNSDGKPGSMLCSTFSIVSGKLDELGKLNAEYMRVIIGSKYSRTIYAYSPVEMTDNKIISIANQAQTSEGYTAQLIATPHKVCQFTPAAAG